MNIIQIRKWFQDGKIKYKSCRLIDYESLDIVNHHVVNHTKEVYVDDYSIGNLRPFRSDMSNREATENMLEYTYKGIEDNIFMDTFIKID